jgi:serine/threonine protein kinase
MPPPHPTAWDEGITALTKADGRHRHSEQTPWQRRRDLQLDVADREHPANLAADLGRLEDRYEVYEEIARGGMATVHLGRSIEPGVPRVVAIKQLHAQLAWNPSFVAMFLDEGRLASRVHHPNVVAPLDFVVRAAQGELCLVMEYVHGETLSHLLNRSIHAGSAPAPVVAAGIMVGVLRGLQAAHEATTEDGAALEIVHRDISPQNIMVGTDGVAHVLDFGVARAKMQDLPTGERDRGGKPAYLAPEQIRFQKIDRRADLFSAGVVLWELLAGRRLFRHHDPRMVWVSILSGDIPPPSRFNPAVPPALDLVVLQAMERDRGRRPPTARHFAQAIIDAIDVASATEIGQWVQGVSGDVLGQRARRVAEIMGGHDLPARPAPRLPRKMPALITRFLGWLSPRRRFSGLGLLVAALAGMAISSGPSRALLRRSTPPAVIQLGRAVHPPEFVPLAALEIAPTSADQEEDDTPAADGPTVFAVDHEAPPADARRGRKTITPMAARQQAVAQIAALNNKAMLAYQRGNVEAARALLQAALTVAGRARLQRHAIAAIAHADLGIVLVSGFKQPHLGIEQFRQALKIDPNVPLSRRYAKPPVAAAFREAVART